MKTNVRCQLFVWMFTILLSCNSDFSEIQKARRKATEKIEIISSRAKFHYEALEKINNLVNDADYNIDLIVNIAEYISKVPYETVTLIRIADIASKANHECPELSEVAKLPIILASGSDSIIRLAKSCIRIKDETDRMKIQDEIEKLKSRAKYKSVEEALRDVEKSVDD